jgi:hypothetical protein
MASASTPRRKKSGHEDRPMNSLKTITEVRAGEQAIWSLRLTMKAARRHETQVLSQRT